LVSIFLDPDVKQNKGKKIYAWIEIITRNKLNYSEHQENSFAKIKNKKTTK